MAKNFLIVSGLYFIGAVVNTPLSPSFRPQGTLRVLQGRLIAHGNVVFEPDTEPGRANKGSWEEAKRRRLTAGRLVRTPAAGLLTYLSPPPPHTHVR